MAVPMKISARLCAASTVPFSHMVRSSSAAWAAKRLPKIRPLTVSEARNVRWYSNAVQSHSIDRRTREPRAAIADDFAAAR